jgi:hypothetical protein
VGQPLRRRRRPRGRLVRERLPEVFFGEVYRFSSTGPNDTLITDSATGIAVDPDDEHLYVNKRDSITEYDETGAPVVEFGTGRIATPSASRSTARPATSSSRTRSPRRW